MGYSLKSPCPNLKKLIFPISTAATTANFFPFFKITKGLGFTIVFFEVEVRSSRLEGKTH
jgi:hypothetical protein